MSAESSVRRGRAPRAPVCSSREQIPKRCGRRGARTARCKRTSPGRRGRDTVPPRARQPGRTRPRPALGTPPPGQRLRAGRGTSWGRWGGARRSGRLRRSVRTAPVMCGRAGARRGAPPPSMIHQALGGGGELDAVSSYALPEATQHADESAFRRRSRARHASRRRGRGRARGGIDGGMTLE